MTKPKTFTNVKLLKKFFTFIFGIIFICLLMVLLEAIIGDFLWNLFSGNYISNFEFLGSFIQLLIPSIVIFFAWFALFRPSTKGIELLERKLGFDFLTFPEDFFYRENNILEKRKCRYLVFYRGDHVVEIFGNNFMNISSIFSNHIFSIGKIDIFLYKTSWIFLFVIMIIDSIYKTVVVTPVFDLGVRLLYEVCLVLLILLILAYLAYMTWRRNIIEHSRISPSPIFHGKFISSRLPTDKVSCIFICPIKRFSEFDQERAESLRDSFLRFKMQENIHNGSKINMNQLKKWARETA